MKNILLSLVILFASACAWSQTTYRGTITSASNTILNEASVKSVSEEISALSNQSGEFEITLNNNNEVEISFIGYKTLKINLESNKNNIITLYKDINSLHEIVVSGNREKQKRSEVPASISVIDSKELDQIKVIGVEQVVNNVPGVYISSSKASSNEQHFAATRSPITTRALFLYLEDGIPIRPTAVFNHNALLELNNISHQRVEVLKGPASSIYGSEAIGGSFNFITKNPTKELSGNLKTEYNSLGLFTLGFEASTAITESTGIYIGTSYKQRRGGPFGHSDYEKNAGTVKLISKLSNKITWTNLLDAIDFRTDTSGSISQDDYNDENYESDQTFTERDALSIRYRSTFDVNWDKNNKTSFNQIFRYNELAQIPSFRVRQSGDGVGTGEINSNNFKSFAGLLQHKLIIPEANLSVIGGTTIDFSPQNYVANVTSTVFDTETRINQSFTINEDNFIANYEADLLNYAFYAQADFKPFKFLSLTAALRYDEFRYDFNNILEDERLPDSVNTYSNLSPKLGFNLNINQNIGFYGNWSTGFTPPQASTLYRSVPDINIDLKPSEFDNFEIGTYLEPIKGLKIDVAGYLLDGKNTLITIEDIFENTFNENAGKTRSFGIEYGVSYKPLKILTISHNGSFANHRYIDFRDGTDDFSNTDRETAPKLIGNSKLILSPVKNFTASLSHELIGKYNTSFENQATDADGNPSTTTYAGHNIFDLLFSLKQNKFEFWIHFLNILDKQHANRVTYDTRNNENDFIVGNNRAIHGGVKYNF